MNSLRCKDTHLPCYRDCDYIFREVIVVPARAGGTLIQWSLGSQIRDEGEYEYSLQAGYAGVHDPDAWQTIQTAKDVCFFIDHQRRSPGVQNFTHYRLKLQTEETIFYSRPLHTFGKLNYANWRLYADNPPSGLIYS